MCCPGRAGLLGRVVARSDSEPAGVLWRVSGATCLCLVDGTGIFGVRPTDLALVGADNRLARALVASAEQTG